MGGYTGTAVTNSAEHYDGSSWTAATNYPGTYLGVSGAGTQTAGLGFGGATANPYPGQNATVEYDGSNWTSGGNLNTARSQLGGAGTQTTGLGFGGFPNGPASASNATEEYDGSSWTTVNTMPTASGGMASWGTQSSALSGGGSTPGFFGTPGLNTTISYDGTNWSSQPNLATARGAVGGAGADNTAGVAFGGRVPSPAYVSTTEEFTISLTATTAAAWASGGNLNTGRYGLRGTGTQTSMVVAGGNVPPNSNTDVTEEYNGSSWSNSNDLPAVIQDGNMCGTQTASIYSGGTINPGSYPGATNHYNGSSWTSGGNQGTDVAQYALAGTSTAAVAFGGYIGSGPGRTNVIQDYDGSSWTSNPVSLPQNLGLMRTAGTQTACIMAGGNNPPAPSPPNKQPVSSLEWDGSSISTGPNNLVGMNDHCGWGTSTNAYFYIGDQPTGSGGSGGKSVNGYYYNGSAFVTSVNATTGKNTTGWAKSSNADSLVCGGNAGSAHLTSTEEFTAETTAARAVKTIDFD